MVKLEVKLKRVASKSIVLLEVPADENPMKIVADFLRYRQDDKGIYISSNRSTKDLVEKLKVHGFNLRGSLDSERTYVIDLVSKSVGADGTKGGINVASPCELSDTQMAFEKAAELLQY